MAFKHINANEQIVDGSIGTSLLADGSVTAAKLAFGAITSSNLLVDSNIDFNNFQALQFRIENLNFFPVAGNPGRLIWRTDLQDIFVDSDFTLNIVSLANIPLQIGIITDATHMSVSSTTGLSVGDALIQGGFPFGQVQILSTIDTTHLVVASTAGISPSEVLVQAGATSVVTSIIDATHMTVANTNGFQPGVATVSTPFVVAVIQSITDGTHLVVDSTAGFVGRAIVSVDFGIVTVTDSTNLVVDNSTAMAVGDTITQGLASTIITSVIDLTHITVNNTAGFSTGIAVVLAPVDVLDVTDSVHLLVSNTAGFGPGDPINQGLASTTIVSVIDSTHLVVMDTNGFALNAAKDSTITVDSTANTSIGMYLNQQTASTVIIAVPDATHLAVADTTGFVPGPAFSGNWVSINEGASVTGIRADNNPLLHGNIQFLSGTNAHLPQLGQTITVNVPAAGATGQLQFNLDAQNDFGADANLFWDNVNKRLGIGNAAPSVALEVTGDVHVVNPTAPNDLTFQSDNDSVIHFKSANGATEFANMDFTSGGIEINHFTGGIFLQGGPAAIYTWRFNPDSTASTPGSLYVNQLSGSATLDVAGTGHFSSDLTVDTKANVDLIVSRTGDLTLQPLTDSFTAVNIKSAGGTRDLFTADSVNSIFQLWPRNDGYNELRINGTGSYLNFADPTGTTYYTQFANSPGSFFSILTIDPTMDLKLVQDRDGNAWTWTFDKLGKLTLPASGQITSPDFVTILTTGANYKFDPTSLKMGDITEATTFIDVSGSAATLDIFNSTSGYETYIPMDTGLAYMEGDNLSLRLGPTYTGGSHSADPSAKLQLDAVDKGFLVPRMTTAQRNAIVSPANGLLIYNTDSNMFNFWTGTSWLPVGSPVGNVGDVQFNAGGGLFGANPNFYWDIANARLGIGNAAPALMLDVSGPVAIRNVANVTGHGDLTFYNDNPIETTIESRSTDGSTVFGNLFLGSGGFELQSNSGVGSISVNTSGTIQTWNYNLDGSFNSPVSASVGFGNNPFVPTATLDVSGTGHFSSDVTVDTKVNVDLVKGRTGDLALQPLTDSASSIQLQNAAGIPYVTLTTTALGAQMFFAGNSGGDTQLTMDATNGAYLLFSNDTNTSYFGRVYSDTSGVLGLQSDNGTVGVQIRSASGSNIWTFDPSGNLTVPGSSHINPASGHLFITTDQLVLDGTSGSLVFTDDNNSQILFNNAANSTVYAGIYSTPVGPLVLREQQVGQNVNIQTSTSLWTFADNGLFTTAGPVDLATHQIHNVVDPTNPQDAATKNYVDGGSHTVAGSNGQIQFNNSGNFGASSNLFWDNTNNRLGIDTSTPGFTVDIANVSGNLRLGTSTNYARLDAGSIGVGAANTSLPGFYAQETGGFGRWFMGFADASNNFGIYWNNTPLFATMHTPGLNPRTSIGDPATPPNASAVLDVQSTTHGFLPPRMTTTQKNAIASPATGLMVYDTTLNNIQEYNGTMWRNVAPLYQQDVFNVAGPGNVFTLTFTPLANSQHVFYNGLALANGVTEDYTISGNVVTLNAGIVLVNGDKILITYSY